MDSYIDRIQTEQLNQLTSDAVMYMSPTDRHMFNLLFSSVRSRLPCFLSIELMEIGTYCIDAEVRKHYYKCLNLFLHHVYYLDDKIDVSRYYSGSSKNTELVIFIIYDRLEPRSEQEKIFGFVFERTRITKETLRIELLTSDKLANVNS